jgi:hypothetical protein
MQKFSSSTIPPDGKEPDIYQITNDAILANSYTTDIKVRSYPGPDCREPSVKSKVALYTKYDPGYHRELIMSGITKYIQAGITLARR